MSDDLISLYRKRLHIHPDEILIPNLKTLRLVTERHLQYLPFENIAIHRKRKSPSKKKRNQVNANKQNIEEEYKPIKLSKQDLIDKLLINHHGGCCLELNGLFNMFLQEIGYTSVVMVPCFVYAGKERGHRNKRAKFRTSASHFVLLVTIEPQYLEDGDHFVPTYENSNSYIVDVGLGEPSLWPLEYVLDKEQVTPEGMKSRMVWDTPWVDGNGKTRQCVILEWFVPHENKWQPRLQWDVNEAPSLVIHEKYDTTYVDPSSREKIWTLDSFHHVIPMLLDPKSNFAKKLVVCKLTRDAKVTLAGRVLKVTSPRFGEILQKEFKDLDTEEDVYETLKSEFNIELNVGQLRLPSLEYSKKSKLWDHL